MSIDSLRVTFSLEPCAQIPVARAGFGFCLQPTKKVVNFQSLGGKAISPLVGQLDLLFHCKTHGIINSS